jgi:hypothetical protein
MKLIGQAAMAVAFTLLLSSCKTVCPTCQPLPATGTYGVCAVTGAGAKHLQLGDKVVIGRIGNVTNVTVARESGKTELLLFQGSRGLVGWAGRENQGHDNHVISIVTVQAPRDATTCNKGTDVIRIDFSEPDNDGGYRGARSSPDYGHAHAQIE